MARIDGEQHGDRGRVREWLARAVTAPRDPAWTADGIVSDKWAPTSPVTGALDAFQWRVPVERIDEEDTERLTKELEQQLALDSVAETMEERAEHRDIADEPRVPVVLDEPSEEDRDEPEELEAVAAPPEVPFEDNAEDLEPSDDVVVPLPKPPPTVEPVPVTLPPPTNPLDDFNRPTRITASPKLRSDTAPLNARMRRKRAENSNAGDDLNADLEQNEVQKPTQLVPEADIYVAPPLPDDPGPDGSISEGPDEDTAAAPRYPKRPSRS